MKEFRCAVVNLAEVKEAELQIMAGKNMPTPLAF